MSGFPPRSICRRLTRKPPSRPFRLLVLSVVEILLPPAQSLYSQSPDNSNMISLQPLMILILVEMSTFLDDPYKTFLPSGQRRKVAPMFALMMSVHTISYKVSTTG